MSKFDTEPRDFALELVENGLVAANHLLLCCLKYMSTDDVRDMLDANELSPRFDEDEDVCADCEAKEWLESWDDGEHDVDAMRIDLGNGNLEVGDDDRVDEYLHLSIVRNSLANGQFDQAVNQCQQYGLDYESIVKVQERVQQSIAQSEV